MSTTSTILLGEIMASKLGSVDPAKSPEELFDLYSIPAFDSRQPEVVVGGLIGSAKQIVQPGDVLLSKIVPHIRRSWVVGNSHGRRLIASSEWIVFRSERIHPDYLRHVLVSDQFHAKFMNTVSGIGGSLLRARPVVVAKIKISLPPLPEQRRIAAILDKADAMRELRWRSIAKLDALLKAVFLEMFGDPVRNPKGWPIVDLGSHLTFVTSGSRGWAEYYSDNGARFIRSLDVQMNYLSDEEAVYVQPPSSAEAERTRVCPGDVLLTITGSKIGRVTSIQKDIGEAYVSQHVAILRLDNQFIPEFVSMFLSTERGGQYQISRLQYGQTKPGLNLEQIRRFKVPLMPIDMQRKFMVVAATVRKQQVLQANSLKRIDELFLSIQQRAFTGKLFTEKAAAAAQQELFAD